MKLQNNKLELLRELEKSCKAKIKKYERLVQLPKNIEERRRLTEYLNNQHSYEFTLGVIQEEIFWEEKRSKYVKNFLNEKED